MDIMNNDDFVLQSLSGGKTSLIYDDKNIGSVMVRVPRFNLGDVITGAPDTPHPMFIVNGVVKDEIYIGKYLGIIKNGRGYSISGINPSTNISFDQALKYCYDKGPGWHLTTNAEYAGVALWCKANGFYPRGNNNNGGDITKIHEKGRRSFGGCQDATVIYTANQQVTLPYSGAVQTFNTGNIKRAKIECFAPKTSSNGSKVYGELTLPDTGKNLYVYGASSTFNSGVSEVRLNMDDVNHDIIKAQPNKTVSGGKNGSQTISAGFYHSVGLKADGTCVAVGNNDSGQCNVGAWTNIISLVVGNLHTVGLKADGTCVAVGRNGDGSGQCNVSGWTNIVAVGGGEQHTVGLKADGTCVAVGLNSSGQCNVSGWTNIVAISAGYLHTVGLKADGTCVSVGENGDGQCGIISWTGIVSLSSGRYHTVGLKADGTCVAVGRNGDGSGQCNVSGWTNIVAVGGGEQHTVGLKADGTCVAVGLNSSGQCNINTWSDIVSLDLGSKHTVGLKAGGTCVAVGDNGQGQCNMTTFINIKQPSKGIGASNKTIAAGYRHTVGLKKDGTCLAVGETSTYGQCYVSGWTGVVAISAGYYHTVGLKADGTCVATGRNVDGTGQCNVSGWTGIVSISAGNAHTVGLKADGTCVAVGNNDYGQCNVSGWTGIVSISVNGAYHTVGLKADGTCVAVGLNSSKQCNVSGWTGIVAVSAGPVHTVGLKADGTCVAIGDNTSGSGECNVTTWTNIVSVSAGAGHTVGLKSDGTCVAVGYNSSGQCNVSGWAGITAISTGDSHTVGLKADGNCVAIGGQSQYGQADVSSFTNIKQPSSSGTTFYIDGDYYLAGITPMPTNPDGIILRNGGIVSKVNTSSNGYAVITVLELFYDSYQTLTGTGPVSWAHTNNRDGIYDLNGNVWEWTSGLRLNNGEINIIKDNDAAIQNADHLSNSVLWKAILQDGSLVSPGTALSLKLDGNANTNGNGKVNTSITLPTTDAVLCNEDFYSMVAASGITIPQILKSLAMYPIDTTDTCGDKVAWFNHKEIVGMRGGAYSSLQAAGLYCLSLSQLRAAINPLIGFRVAYYKP